ncbi:MAG: polysaccharide deacetylase family protein [Deltaproteobacteria bacterium]|jgi:peptidoglycan/xylan/chitin deacetylase (PgdA/CDA1 family)|nr:polysaccharide deacetylase family protein [Deltaproteobacteria bacterium]
MLKKKTVFMFSLLLAVMPSLCLAAADATILIYHRFGDQRYPTTNVSVEAFTQQMDFLDAHHYTVIPLAELITLVKKREEIPAKTVVITIDDAYASVYEKAWPILREYGYPFTVFVYTKGVEQNSRDYMSWSQLRELGEQGVDFQDHGFSHAHMAFKPENMEEVGYRSWISGDLVKSRALLSRELGDTPRFFALPYGEYNTIVLEEARALGYEAILTQDPGAVGPYSDPFCLPRQPILGKEWAAMPHFKEILQLVDLPLTDLTPPPQQLADAMVTRYQARMLDPEKYSPGTFGFWVSGLGWHQGQREGDILFFNADRPLLRPVTRVVVSGRESKSGNLATRTWMLIHPDGDKAGE